MAITSYDELIAGLLPRVFWNKGVLTNGSGATHPWTSMWPGFGNPGGGGYGSGLSGTILDSSFAQVGGQIPFHASPSSPDQVYSYVARLQHGSAADQQNFNTRVAWSVLLADRLWSSGGINITASPAGGAQAVNSVAWPPRDWNQSSDGYGIYCAFEVASALGTGGPGSFYIDYTAADGTARTGAAGGTGGSASVSNSCPTGAFGWFNLATGDRGVRSIQNVYSTAAWSTGAVALVAFRPICYMEVPQTFRGHAFDALCTGMARMFPGSVPFVMNLMAGNNTRTDMQGHVQFANG